MQTNYNSISTLLRVEGANKKLFYPKKENIDAKIEIQSTVKVFSSLFSDAFLSSLLSCLSRFAWEGKVFIHKIYIKKISSSSLPVVCWDKFCRFAWRNRQGRVLNGKDIGFMCHCRVFERQRCKFYVVGSIFDRPMFSFYCMPCIACNILC